jgi:hypothetical protein
MFFGDQDVDDLERVIAWAAEQAWCDGNVVMFGMSYYGVVPRRSRYDAHHRRLATGSVKQGTDADLTKRLDYPGGDSTGVAGGHGCAVVD